jgi:hypothetical protein
VEFVTVHENVKNLVFVLWVCVNDMLDDLRFLKDVAATDHADHLGLRLRILGGSKQQVAFTLELLFAALWRAKCQYGHLLLVGGHLHWVESKNLPEVAHEVAPTWPYSSVPY